MFTEIHYPEFLPHKKLDEYLARGWFRMGQMIFTCRFLCFDGKLYTAVWTRLPLKDYTFRKSVRKVLNRNNKRFRVEVRRAIFDKEKSELYLIHRRRFGGYVSTNLRKSLFGDADYNIYDTWETSVYDGDRLVAASFFDLGNNSIASIMGLFHPDYAKYSLGFYTMLLEIDFGKKTGADFYYPGYVVPHYQKFDYKLRIGDTEYYDPDRRNWFPYADLKLEKLSSNILVNKLKALQQYLHEKGMDASIYLYPLYERVLFGHEYKDFLHNPLFISCYHQKYRSILLIVEYDLFQKTYRLIRAGRIENNHAGFMNAMRNGHDSKTSFFDFLFKEKVILETTDFETLAKEIFRSSRWLRV
ncbi:MAG: hypothetical protein AAF573_13125 [Bacteroidota bacterium]